MERVEAGPLSDTTAEADALLLQLLRQTPIRRKWELMSQLNDMTRSLALGDLKRRDPHATADELRRLLADRLLGAELAETVYGAKPTLQESSDVI